MAKRNDPRRHHGDEPSDDQPTSNQPTSNQPTSDQLDNQPERDDFAPQPDTHPDDEQVDQHNDVADHNPEGFDVASRIMHGYAGLLPPARTGPDRRRRRRARNYGEEQRSGARPDDRDPQPVGAALDRLVGRQGWKTELGLRLIVARWSELVGPTNAEHSTPEAYRGKVLIVRAESSAWASALRTITPHVVAELNRRLGQGSVTRIEVHGPSAPSWKHGRRSVPGRGPRDTYG